jgi:hypothetical protein
MHWLGEIAGTTADRDRLSQFSFQPIPMWCAQTTEESRAPDARQQSNALVEHIRAGAGLNSTPDAMSS